MIEAGKYVQLKRPEFPSIFGQGEMPEALKIEKNGASYTLPFGNIYVTSDEVDVLLETEGTYPSISTEIVASMEDQFKIINNGE